MRKTISLSNALAQVVARLGWRLYNEHDTPENRREYLEALRVWKMQSDYEQERTM